MVEPAIGTDSSGAVVYRFRWYLTQQTFLTDQMPSDLARKLRFQPTVAAWIAAGFTFRRWEYLAPNAPPA